MPNVKVYDMEGNAVGDIELSQKIFGATINPSAVHTVVRAYLLNQRQGTQSTLTRAEVSGGGKKPWRQKGTGRARQGSTRSPQWTHGGIVFAPKPRSYRVSVNKKVKQLAIFSAFSSKVAANELIVLDNIAFEGYKTKKVVEMLSKFETGKKTLIILGEPNGFFVKSASNIAGVQTAPVNAISVYDILNCDKLIIAKSAVEKLEEVYA